MRPSQYNLIENHGERTLVMNAKTGAILSLDKQHAESMCRMVSGTEWEPDELREALLQGGMLLEDDRDEKRGNEGNRPSSSIFQSLSRHDDSPDIGVQLLLPILL